MQNFVRVYHFGKENRLFLGLLQNSQCVGLQKQDVINGKETDVALIL
jgi:hypothetical protein